MIFFQLLLITLIAEMCYSEFVQVFHPFNPVTAPLLPICPPTSHQRFDPLLAQPHLEMSTAGEEPRDHIKFILPFLDMEVQYDRNLHIMQEQKKQQLYILHGHELYQLFINRQEKRLSLVAELAGAVRHVQPLGAQIIFWQSNFLLIIALEEHLEVYQLPENVLQQRAEAVKDFTRAAEPAPVFEAIQQLTLTGRFQKLFLFSPAKERVMIVAAVHFTKLYGKLRIFEWFNTYFDPVEEMAVPNINVVQVIGSETKYLITGRAIKHQTRTILTVHEISSTSPALLPKQTLTVESHIVHIFTYLNRNMIVACSNTQQQCNSFRQMPDGHFAIYRRRTSKEFAFDLMSSSTRFVSASRQNRIMVFTNHRLDCYASFMTDQVDVTDIMGYQNSYNEDYVLLIYKRPFKVLVRIVELQINNTDLPSGQPSDPEEVAASNHHQHLFESTINQLRSVLLRRKMDMDKFRKVSQILKQKLKVIDVKDTVTLHAGKVGIIKVTGEVSKSPKQIAERIESLARELLPQRAKRSDNQQLFNATPAVRKKAVVQRMRVENLIYHGDVMEGFSLSQNNLNIKPKVSTRALNTSELILPQVLQQTHDLIFDMPNPLPSPAVRVSHLEVEFINGVPWNAFYNLLFLKNRDKVIEGSVMMLAEVKVTDLKTTILNGLIVSKLFNLKYPQIINSELTISRFFVDDLKATTVNGLIFEEDVVFSGTDTFIETPVKMHHLSISADLSLANNTKAEHTNLKADGIEFKQFYTNKIIVNGSLIVKNLKRLNNETRIMLEDQEFDVDKIKETYLLSEQEQNFSFPVIFEEAKVTASSLKSNYLNDHPTGQHMLLNKVSADTPLMAIFMNAHVNGDVIISDFKTKIAEIKENIIHRGDRVHITGTKQFEALLEVNNVEVSLLNQLPVKDLVFKTNLTNSDGIQFKDTKTFKAIKVKSRSIVEQELNAAYLNNLPLESLLTNDYYMDRFYASHMVATTNLVFHKINGIAFHEFFAKLDVKDERLVLHKDLIVEGNAKFIENLQVSYINGIAWNEYVENLVRANENAVVEGEVSFKEDLTITSTFETSEINGFDLEIILKNLLLKSKPQLITGSYRFDNIKGSNLDVSLVNNVPVSQFIDLSRNFTEIEGDLIVENLYVNKNLQGNWSGFEHLLFVKEKINNLITSMNGKRLHVFNNVSWSESVKDNDQQQLLKYLYKSAVRNRADQTITGNVRICQPFIKRMQTRTKFPANVDLEFILQDAVLRNTSAQQIIQGEKVFLNTVTLETLEVKNNLNTKFLNDIDVSLFNLSLYRLTSQQPLQATMKFLKPPTVGRLQLSNGLVNGLNTSLIYQLDENVAIPYVQLQELYIENDLFIENINDMSLTYFLDNRVTLKGPALEHFGVLTFENLVIQKEALIQTINGVAVDNLVFKHSPQLQIIKGHKTVSHSLELAGPAHIMRLNDKDLTELHHNSLMKDQNYEFDKLLLEQATFERGLQVLRTLDTPQQRSFQESAYTPANDREKFLIFLKEFKDNLTLIQKNIIYLDYDFSTHIKWLVDSTNLAANHTIHHELSRISSCEKEYVQVSFQYPNNIYLKNITSNRLSKTSNRISVEAENFCRPKQHKVKSKVTISGQKLLKVFGLKRYIETIYTLQDVGNNTEHFVVLHLLDLPSLKRNEVRIFKISTPHNNIKEWQGLTLHIGQQLKLYEFNSSRLLLTNGLIDHHPAVTIYNFNNTSQQFKVQQTLDGDHDIMEMIEMPKQKATTQLILSCSRCRRVFIYESNATTISGKYEISQIITLKSQIDKLVIFHLHNEYYMLVVSQRDSNYYSIYKYAYIQGWLPLTFGYFPNLQMSIPVTDLWTTGSVNLRFTDGVPLILLCNSSDCHLVKAIL